MPAANAIVFFISGVRFRRQHCCILSLIVLVLILCLAIGLPLSADNGIEGNEDDASNAAQDHGVTTTISTMTTIMTTTSTTTMTTTTTTKKAPFQVPKTPEERQAIVQQLLTEVPLVDG
jgi:hypothetical protein